MDNECQRVDTESGHVADCWLDYPGHCDFGTLGGCSWADIRLRKEAGVVVGMVHAQIEVGQPALHLDVQDQL
jgi:hypothetical protein